MAASAEDERHLGVERVLFLRSLTVAQPPPGDAAIQLAAAMRDRYFKRDAVIYDLGDPSGDVFFVVRGAVRLSAPDLPPWDFEAPAVAGVVDSVTNRRRTRRAVAMTDVHALALKADDWFTVLEEHFDFARASMFNVSASLHAMRMTIAGDGGYPKPPPPAPAAHGLNLFERTLALRELAVFRRASVQVTMRLAELATEVDLGQGDVLLAEGEAPDAIFAVAGGQIAIERTEPPLRASFGPGSLVGGSSAMAIDVAPFTSRAEVPSTVLRIAKDDVLDAMEDHFDLTRSILAGLGIERDSLMQVRGLVHAEPVSRAARSSKPPEAEATTFSHTD